MPFWLLAGILLGVQGCNVVLGQVTGGPAEDPISFCAVRNANLASGASVLPFTSVPLNDGNAFDATSNSFTVPSTSNGGLFWLTWSIGIPASVFTDVRLDGASRSPNLLREHSAYTGVDTNSRTELIDLAPSVDTITLSTDYGLFSDAGFQTSFCGFSLFSAMGQVVAFNVGRTTTLSTTGTIVYDLVNVDTDTGYSSTTGEYTVKVEGVYVVSFTVASVAGAVLTDYNLVHLCVSPACYVASIYLVKPGVDMASQTVLVDAAVGQKISVKLDRNAAYGDIRYQTSLMGFLYNPARIVPYSWSVANVVFYSNPIDPVPFDIILVNQGGGWSSTTNRYTVQAAGVYYIHMTAGMQSGYPSKLELLVNGVANVNIHRQSIQHADWDTRGRAYILRLDAGNELRLRLPSGFRIYSDTTRVTTFSGFRLYA